MRRASARPPLPWRQGLLGAVLFAAAALAQLWAGRAPGIVESLYARTLYPPVASGIGALTGGPDLVIGELAAVALVAGLGLWALTGVIAVLRRRRSFVGVLLRGVLRLLLVVGLLYGTGVLLWGFHYQRPAFGPLAGLDVSPASLDELRGLAERLVVETNAARRQVDEDERGVLDLIGGRRGALERAPLGFRSLEDDYPFLPVELAARPKPLALSRLASWTGIGGVFVPWTHEPTVNALLVAPDVPSSASHEIAHRLGVAREDEASFVGYLANERHPDPDFRYGAKLSALRQVLAALGTVDREAASALGQRLEPGVVRDIAASRAFWRAHHTRLEEAAFRVYDLHLRAQGDRRGVESYGRMVDLLIALDRARSRQGARPPA